MKNGQWRFSVVKEVSDQIALVGTCVIHVGRRANIVTAPRNIRVSRTQCKPILKMHRLAGKFIIHRGTQLASQHRIAAEPGVPAWAIELPVEDLNRDFNLGEVEAL